jgi:hypothetical protein
MRNVLGSVVTGRGWTTIGLGAVAAALAGLGLPLIGQIIAPVVGTVAAALAVRYTSEVARYVVLAVVVGGPATSTDRPPAWQLVLVAVAVTGFLLAPEADRRDPTSWLAVAAGIPLAGALAVLAQHQGRGSWAYVIGLAALVIAFFVAIHPAAGKDVGSEKTIKP